MCFSYAALITCLIVMLSNQWHYLSEPNERDFLVWKSDTV